MIHCSANFFKAKTRIEQILNPKTGATGIRVGDDRQDAS